MQIVLSAVKFLCNIAFKLIKFFGLLPLLICVFAVLFVPAEWQDSALFNALYMVLIYAMMFLAAALTLRNVIRFKNPGFCWMPLIMEKIGKKKSIGFQAKNTSVTSADLRGMFFGAKNGKYVVKPEEEDGHALIIGGAGSGKTTNIGVNTLQIWKGRLFALDLKPELYDKCKEVRGEENILVLDPTDPNSCGYDPLYILRESTNPAQAAMNIAASIIPLSPDVKEPMWIENAQAILAAALIYYKDMSFAAIIRNVRMRTPKDLIEEMYNGDNDLAKMLVSSLQGASEQTLGSIASELAGKITIFATDTELISTLDNSRYHILKPYELEEKDVFLKIPEHNLKIWSPFVTLILNQFLESFERRPNDINQTPILFMLDEFPRLGKVPSIQDGLATLRSKKIEIMLFVQSKSQLDAIYGQDKTKSIVDNCTWKAVLKATEPETQRWLSDMVGTYDANKKSQNFNQNDMGITSGSGISKTTEEKRIIKPEEFAYLDKQLVLLSPNGYDIIDKVPYYADANFWSERS